MDLKTLRTQTVDALTRSLSEAEQQLCDYRFQLASHQLKQVRRVRQLRQDIARLHLVLREKN